MEQKYLTQLTEQPVPPGESAAWGPRGGCGGGGQLHGTNATAVPPCRDAEWVVVAAGPRAAGGGGASAAPARHPGESAAQTPDQAQGVPAGGLPACCHGYGVAVGCGLGCGSASPLPTSSCAPRPHLPSPPRGGRRHRRVSGSVGPVVGDGEDVRGRPVGAAVGGGAGAACADGRPADPGRWGSPRAGGGGGSLPCRRVSAPSTSVP